MAKKKTTRKRSNAAKTATFSKADVEAEIRARATTPLQLRDWLDRYFPFIVGPTITYFEPTSGAPGTLVTIHGSDFSAVREENLVVIGGVAGYVASASATELKVITASTIKRAGWGRPSWTGPRWRRCRAA